VLIAEAGYAAFWLAGFLNIDPYCFCNAAYWSFFCI
jgi:hypothetical protein